MRVCEVAGLGWDAARVTIEGEQVLLMEAALPADDRIELLNRVMADLEPGRG